jgi:transmembrane sensor
MIESGKGREYADFGIGDFVCDAFFQDWIIHGENAAFWEAWIREHPEKTSVIGDSRMLLLSLRFKEDLPEEDRVQQSLTAALDTIVVRKMDWTRNWRRIAAILIGVGICGALYYYAHRHAGAQQEQVFATAYGEMRTLYLPDSSKVVLNGHSTIRYAGDWNEKREVWLEGEAFFDVRHSAASTFRVHTKELAVDVLGTAFDIRERRGTVEVVLQSGKIKVQFMLGDHEGVLMEPGDKLVYDPAKASLVQAPIVPENYTSWKDKRLTDLTVAQIVAYVEDNYGKKIILEDPSMGLRKIGGTVLLDNLNDALFALSTVLDVTVVQKDDTLILRPR